MTEYILKNEWMNNKLMNEGTNRKGSNLKNE